MRILVTCNSLDDVIGSLEFLFPILISDFVIVDFGVPHVPVDSKVIFLARLLNPIRHLKSATKLVLGYGMSSN